LGVASSALSLGFGQTFVASGGFPAHFESVSASLAWREWGTFLSGTPGHYFNRASVFSSTLNLGPRTEYLNFAYGPPGNQVYGWIELTASVSSAFGPDASFGPDVVIDRWAYTDTGYQLPAGSLVDPLATATPEPATALPAALAVLALGAAARRKRLAR
jgi:hypothetical protein